MRHALAGRCVVKTDSALFEDATAVDMVLDILAERGYHAVYQEHRTPVPRSVDPQTGTITCQDRVEHTFEIHFHPPEIRRGRRRYRPEARGRRSGNRAVRISLHD